MHHVLIGCFNVYLLRVYFSTASHVFCFILFIFLREREKERDSLFSQSLSWLQLLSGDQDRPGLIDCNSCQSVVC